jgi:hypothetical protein
VPANTAYQADSKGIIRGLNRAARAWSPACGGPTCFGEGISWEVGGSPDGDPSNYKSDSHARGRREQTFHGENSDLLIYNDSRARDVAARHHVW